jgi:hypothetical protein
MLSFLIDPLRFQLHTHFAISPDNYSWPNAPLNVYQTPHTLHYRQHDELYAHEAKIVVAAKMYAPASSSV